jgi:dihydroorotate dehydrogenase (fumarate)
MQKCGTNGVVAFSRCLGMDIDLATEAPVLHGGYGGHGGPWAIHYALRWVSEMYAKLQIPISGCGGVTDWEDVVKYILSGATTVQVCFLVYAYGYSVIEKLNTGLLAYMDKKGYRSLEEFRGKITGKIKGLKDVDREKKLKACADSQACIGCARCADICIYDGIDYKDKKASINEKCDGCGLCPYFCQKGALSMVSR